MDALLNTFLLKLHFFATGLGLLTIGAVAISIILFWQWRLALLSLLVVQTGVAVLVVEIQGVAPDWAAVQIIVIALCIMMLGLSAQQIHTSMTLRWPGSWLLRCMALLLLLVSWQVFHLKLTIPLLSPQIAQLFVWLGLCTLLLLSLSDTPFFTGIALLLWCIPVQAIVTILLPVPALFLLINILEIVVALACSYLMLTARVPVLAAESVVTDLTFPGEAPATTTWPQNGDASINGQGGGSSNGQVRKPLPPEPTTEYPFAVGGSS